jgi:peptidoglycan/LPS O-acetylase OafA/YrhL
LLFSLLVFVIAIATAYLLKPANLPITKYESIDGLRGFLALGVFIHHVAVWQQFLQTGLWQNPPTNLFVQLGETSVSLFFMITSFLFVSKLLNQPEAINFDWNKFIIGRIFRVAPLYYFILFVLIIIVFYQSNWKIKTDLQDLTKSIGNWAFFTINAIPSINKFKDTSIIMARVVWSLPYEWLFYFCLPLIGIFLLKKKPSWYILLISAGAIIIFHLLHGISIKHIVSFVGGAIAPILFDKSFIKSNINNWVVSLSVILCLASLVLFKSAHHFLCKAIITFLFTCIACGNTIFGLLRNKAIKLLGLISYSTYLWHGVLLYVTFKIILKDIDFTNLTLPFYSLILFILTPTLVIISCLSYQLIEKPFMVLGKRLSNKGN